MTAWTCKLDHEKLRWGLAPEHGLGAWWHLFRKGDDARSDPHGRLAHGITGWKGELVYNGFGAGVVEALPFFGDAADRQTRAFQSAHGLAVDGVVGRQTGSALLRKRKQDAELLAGVPSHWLCRIGTWEGGNDVVAQGWLNPDDEGTLQYNLAAHPDLTQDECWRPAFILPRGARDLVQLEQEVGGDWEGAVAAWNQGAACAHRWVKAGKPADGDACFAACATYVANVRASSC